MNWQLVDHLVPEEVCEAIAGINPPVPGQTDFVVWNAASDGQFSLKTVYSVVSAREELQPPIPLFKKVWKWEGPAIMESMLWKIVHGRLITNVERKERGMSYSDLYPRCHRYPETIIHLLRDCEEVNDFWSKHLDPSIWSRFFSLGQQAWLDWNMSSSRIRLVQWN